LVTFGSIAFGVYKYYGLNIYHWLICVGIGSLGMLVNFGLKFIDEEKLCLGFSSQPLINE
jgi:hypothetical protein